MDAGNVLILQFFSSKGLGLGHGPKGLPGSAQWAGRCLALKSYGQGADVA